MSYTLSVRLEPIMSEYLKAKAAEKGVSVSVIVRQALMKTMAAEHEEERS